MFFIVLIAVICLSSGLISCRQKSYQEVNDIDYDVSILIPDGMTEEEWMDSTLFVEYEIPYTGQNYYSESKGEAISTTEYLFVHKVLKYTGKELKETIKQYDYLSKLIFKWQCQFDVLNDKVLSYCSHEYIDQWVEYFFSEIRKVATDFDITSFEDLELSIRYSYFDVPPMDSDFWRK